MTTYSPAPAVQKIAEKVIREHHPDLADFAPHIEYVFRDKAAKSKGRVKLGSARKIGGLNAFLASDSGDDFYVVEIAEDEWQNLTAAQKVALVDHELMHFVMEADEDTGAVTLGIRGHDVEEFVEVVRRHGPWKEDVEHLVKVAMEQMEIPFDDDEHTEEDA